MSRFFILLNIVFLALSISNNSFAQSKTVSFKGRTIDLEPYVNGFPYSGFKPYFSAGKLYYNHVGSTTTLKEIDLERNADLRNGKSVSDIDYSKRNIWTTRFNQSDKHLYWTGDEKNDEVIN